MKPVQAGSSLRAVIRSSRNSWVMSPGWCSLIEAIPTCSQSRCLPATYDWLPGSSPIRTVPSPGRDAVLGEAGNAGG